MALEIERKFLLKNNTWRPAERSVHCRQAYLVAEPGLVVRIRTIDDQAALAIKTQAAGIARHEYEYTIPLEDAEELLAGPIQGTIVEKQRHYVIHASHTWEIDVFEGDNAGLVIAEIELDDEHEAFDLPPWVGLEITADPRYLNANLARLPYTAWQ